MVGMVVIDLRAVIRLGGIEDERLRRDTDLALLEAYRIYFGLARWMAEHYGRSRTSGRCMLKFEGWVEWVDVIREPVEELAKRYSDSYADKLYILDLQDWAPMVDISPLDNEIHIYDANRGHILSIYRVAEELNRGSFLLILIIKARYQLVEEEPEFGGSSNEAREPTLSRVVGFIAGVQKALGACERVQLFFPRGDSSWEAMGDLSDAGSRERFHRRLASSPVNLISIPLPNELIEREAYLDISFINNYIEIVSSKPNRVKLVERLWGNLRKVGR